MIQEELRDYVDRQIENRMEAIAELAAKKALEHVYADIGKGVLKKLIWVAGVVALALLSWMAGHGSKIPSP